VRRRIQPLIVLLGPYFMTDFTVGGEDWSHANLELFHRFNRAIARVAEQDECLYVDVLAANGETPWMVHGDGVHANDLGHRVVANAVFQTLAQNCSGLAKRTKEAERTSPRWRDESVLKAEYGH
jgi:lysophospholipase L1-like esterase